MKKSNGFCHNDLINRIHELKAAKKQQQVVIGEKFNEVVATFNPENILKSTFKQLTTDKEIQTDALKIATSLGTSFVIDKIIGGNKGIKGYLGSLVAQKLSSSLVGSLFSKLQK